MFKNFPHWLYRSTFHVAVQAKILSLWPEFLLNTNVCIHIFASYITVLTSMQQLGQDSSNLLIQLNMRILCNIVWWKISMQSKQFGLWFWLLNKDCYATSFHWYLLYVFNTYSSVVNLSQWLIPKVHLSCKILWLATWLGLALIYLTLDLVFCQNCIICLIITNQLTLEQKTSYHDSETKWAQFKPEMKNS